MACPVKLFIVFIVNCLLSIYGSVCANKTDPFYVEVESHETFPVHIKDNEERELAFTFRNYQGTVFKIMPVIDEPDLAEVKANMSDHLEAETSTNLTMKLKGSFLGKTFLRFYVNTTAVHEPDSYDLVDTHELDKTDWYQLKDSYEVTISRVESAISHSFTGMVIVLVCLANVAMGCKTEIQVVKEVLRRPVGPLTGMFS